MGRSSASAMSGSMIDIQRATAENGRGKKKKKKEETAAAKYNLRLCYATRP